MMKPSRKKAEKTKPAEKLPEFLEVTAGGKTWRFGRVGYEVVFESQEEVRKQRRAEFKAVLETIAASPKEQRTAATVTAMDALIRNVCVSSAEANEWLATPSGTKFQHLKSLRAADPAVTPEQAEECWRALTPDDHNRVNQFIMLRFLGA